MLDWLPQILARNGTAAQITYGCFLFSLLLLQSCAALALLDYQSQNLQHDLKWSQKKAALTMFLIAVFALLLPPILFLRDSLAFFSQQLLMPLAATGICIVCGWMIPQKALASLWGRGFLEDSLMSAFLWALRYLIPAVLLLGILRSLYREF